MILALGSLMVSSFDPFEITLGPPYSSVSTWPNAWQITDWVRLAQRGQRERIGRRTVEHEELLAVGLEQLPHAVADPPWSSESSP